MDDKKQGYSLRKKRSVRPKISAPKQISAPMPTQSGAPGLGAASMSSGGPGGFPPKPTSRPSTASSNQGPPPSRDGMPERRERPPPAGGGAKTSEMVKRRYSTRVTQLPDFSAGAPDLPPMPSIPSMPSQFADSRPPPSRGGRPSMEGRTIKVDIKALRDPALKPEQYVANVLADATETDIQAYQMDLQKIKNRTSSDLQYNVYQNRTQFIKISKEAEKLKGEMRTLRTMMSELTGALNQVTVSSGGSNDGGMSNGHLSPDAASTASSKRSNRSSVANLEALWSSHLQTLWKRVEGSQKFLPASPGRHIVYENGRWVELNAATWKARRRVHLILLNDHLLIATEKKRPENANSKNQPQQQNKQLVAQRCWPLQDVQITDLGQKSSQANSASANAINVRVGAESFTYAVSTSVPEEKPALLQNFRKAAEELRKNAEAESQRRSKAADSFSYFAARDTNLLQRQPGLLNGLSGDKSGGQRGSASSVATTSASTPLLVDVEGKQRDFRWLEGELDELDIDIALQKFEEAVGRVEKLQRLADSIRGNSAAQELVNLKVGERAARLAAVITRQLVATHGWMTSTKEHVSWLIKLGFEDRAREAYLEARTDILRKRVRQTLFDGDLPTYLYQTSFITFTLVRNTLSTFQQCFSPFLNSAAIKWAKDRVDDFNMLLNRQLSSIERGSEVWDECLSKAKSHAKMLQEVGVDFGNLIGPVDVTDGEDGAGPGPEQVGLGVRGR